MLADCRPRDGSCFDRRCSADLERRRSVLSPFCRPRAKNECGGGQGHSSHAWVGVRHGGGVPRACVASVAFFFASIVCLRPPFASLLRFRCACVDHSFVGFKCGIAAVLARVRCWRFTSRMRHANARVVAIFLALREPEAKFCVWRGARSASEIPTPTSAAGHPDRAGRSWTTTGPVGVVAAAIAGQ